RARALVWGLVVDDEEDARHLTRVLSDRRLPASTIASATKNASVDAQPHPERTNGGFWSGPGVVAGENACGRASCPMRKWNGPSTSAPVPVLRSVRRPRGKTRSTAALPSG